MQADNISASAWMDSKVVTAMFNGYDPAEVTTVLRRQKDGTRNSVPCPVAIADYNDNMGGVDRVTSFVGITLPKSNAESFTNIIVNFLVVVSLTNSFILQHLGRPGSKLSLKKFQELVAKQLIGDYCSRRKAERVSLSTRHHLTGSEEDVSCAQRRTSEGTPSGSARSADLALPPWNSLRLLSSMASKKTNINFLIFSPLSLIFIFSFHYSFVTSKYFSRLLPVTTKANYIYMFKKLVTSWPL